MLLIDVAWSALQSLQDRYERDADTRGRAYWMKITIVVIGRSQFRSFIFFSIIKISMLFYLQKKKKSDSFV